MQTSSTSRELQPILPAASNPAGFSLPVLLVRNRPDRQHGEPVGVCHVFNIQFGYYPPHAVSERDNVFRRAGRIRRSWRPAIIPAPNFLNRTPQGLRVFSYRHPGHKTTCPSGHAKGISSAMTLGNRHAGRVHTGVVTCGGKSQRQSRDASIGVLVLSLRGNLRLQRD
jgi:hypothetical protein